MTMPTTHHEGRANPHHEKRWWILAVLGLAQLMVVLDATIVNIALPSAQQSLGISDDDRQWIVTAYALSFGSLLLLGGRISDEFGRKWTFVGGLAGFAVASAAGGAAQSFDVLVVARAAQGAFAALLAPAALSLLTTTFTDGSERAKAFGVYSAIAGGGAAIGLLLGGVLTEHLSWRWCLYVNLAFAIPAAAAGLVLLVNQRAPVRRRLDLPGAALVTAGLFAIVYGVSNAETSSWTDATTVGFLAAGVALVVAFVLVERSAPSPLFPLRIALDRDRAASFIGVGVASMAIFGVFLFVTYYLQQTLGYSPVETGLAFLPMFAGLVAIALLGSSVLLPRLGRKLLVSAGMVVAAGGMVLLTRVGIESTYAEDIAPGLVVVGLGVGLVYGAGFSGGTIGVTADDAGVASATLNTFQQIGGSFGTALLSTIFASAVKDGIADRGPGAAAAQLAAVDGSTSVFWGSAVIFAAGAVITGLLYRPGRPIIEVGDAPVLAH
jgi:EmrB/QacA subfamily drug resistance transporter